MHEQLFTFSGGSGRGVNPTPGDLHLWFKAPLHGEDEINGIGSRTLTLLTSNAGILQVRRLLPILTPGLLQKLFDFFGVGSI